MAGVTKLNRMLAALALLCSAGVSLCGQAVQGIPVSPQSLLVAPGSITGHLTDLHSVPLSGVVIVVRNEATGAESRTTTAKNGSYRLTQLAPGLYTLEAASPQLGHGLLTGILVQSGHEARLQAAISFDAPELPRLPGSQPPAAPRLEAARPIPPEPTQPAAVEQHSQSPATAVLKAPAAIATEPTRSAHAAAPALTSQLAAVTHAAPQGLSTESVELPSRLPTRRRPIRRLNNLPLIEAYRPGPTTEAVAPSAATPDRNLSATLPAPAALAQASTSLAHAATSAAVAKSGISAPPPSSAEASTDAAAAARQKTMQQMEQREQSYDRRENAASAPGPSAEAATSTLTGNELQALPVSGRRWEDFALDTTESASSTGGRTALRGPGQGEADTTVDGVSTRLAFGTPGGQAKNATGETEGTPEGTGAAWSGGRGFAVSEAAIDKLESSAGHVGADASRAAGGRTQLTTLRGRNGLHGQFFLHDRENVWGARNPSTQWVRKTAAGTSTTLPTFTAEPYTPSDHELVWGVGLGRQIRRNRLFWFAALDATRRNDPAVSMVKHADKFFAQPSDDRMQLLGAQLGSGSLAFPRYSQMLETLAGLLGPVARTSQQWVGFGRVDWNLGERHRLTAELTASHWDSPGGGFSRLSAAYGNHSFGSTEANDQRIQGRWEAFLTPNLLAVTQASYGRTVLSSHAETPSDYEQSLNINVWGQLPQVVVDATNGFNIGNPARFGAGSYPDERVLHLHETVDWVHGKLLVKAGFQFDHFNDHTSLLRNQTGTYHYANVENFATDALVYAAYGMAGSLNKFDQHNCDQTGKVWRDSASGLRGLGYLPCYSYYTQTMGPSNWFVKTNELAGYATLQWQAAKFAVFSAGLRWELEQLPQPIPEVLNSALPLTMKSPSLGNNWGPRLSLAIGGKKLRWPTLRMGYGIYYNRIPNSILQTVLSHTGSLNGDMSFYLRPTDNLNGGGAPPFPYVFAGEPLSLVKPGAVEFALGFRNPEVHQALVGIEQNLPGRIQMTASAAISFGRRLPVTTDTNFDPAKNPGTITYTVSDTSGKGPIKASRITVPLYATWPSATSPTGTVGRLNTGYQQIVEMASRANSTYEAAMVRINRYGGNRGLTFHAYYTYSHAMDWNPNESLRVTGGSVLDPKNFGLEYGVSNLDTRHSASVQTIYDVPWKLRRPVLRRLTNDWSLSGTGHYRSGLPYTMHTSGSSAKEFTSAGAAIVGIGTGMNGSGGDNRIYGLGNDGVSYNLGRNNYRYPATWKADLRVTKRFDLSHQRRLELFAETFNLFNHRNVTEIETTGYTLSSGTISGGLPVLTYLSGLKANSTAFGQPYSMNATNYYRERQIQFGMRVRF